MEPRTVRAGHDWCDAGTSGVPAVVQAAANTTRTTTDPDHGEAPASQDERRGASTASRAPGQPRARAAALAPSGPIANGWVEIIQLAVYKGSWVAKMAGMVTRVVTA